MPVVRAEKLPRKLLHSFVDAIEAWSQAEHDLFMLWQFLSRCRDMDAAWAKFSDWNPSRQRQETEKAIEATISSAEVRGELMSVIERMRSLAEKRNRIVHGRWQVINIWDGSRHAGLEYLRIYDARAEPARPINEGEGRSMLGQTRFYAPDLSQAELEFRELARNLHGAISQVIPFVAPRFAK